MVNSFCKISNSTYTLIIVLLACYSPQNVYGQNGLLAEYFDGPNFERYVSKAYVGNIENYWNDVPPVSNIDPHSCSIRWTGKLLPGKSGTYIFSAIVDDGIRVWINGEKIINQWDLNDFGVFNGRKELVANHEYDIKVEYFNALKEAEIKLMWAIEKPAEEETWSEYFFGVEYDYEVISSDFFVRSEPVAIVKEQPKKPVPPPVKKIKKKPEPAPVKSKKEVIPPPPPPQIVKREVMTIAKAEKYIPTNVQFAISKSEVLESSYKQLNTFAKFMIDNPKVSVTIEGQTDAVGDKKLNQELSESRAEKIASYLAEKGIQKSRINTIGFGGSKPLKKLPEGESYPLNRRVVFVLEGLDN